MRSAGRRDALLLSQVSQKGGNERPSKSLGYLPYPDPLTDLSEGLRSRPCGSHEDTLTSFTVSSKPVLIGAPGGPPLTLHVAPDCVLYLFFR
jgi:hypothetical protein